MSKKYKQGGAAMLAPETLRERVDRAVREERFHLALEFAKQLNKLEPTVEHQELLNNIYLGRARQLRAQGHARDAQTVLGNLRVTEIADPQFLAKVAEELARCGEFQRAQEILARLPSQAGQAQILGHAADNAVLHPTTNRQGLPDPLRSDLDAILLAARETEAGHDEQARQALQPIGLQSPFLEWKVFLRGLLAYYRNDIPRALENWQRLNNERVPARVAAPLRMHIDASYRHCQRPETQAILQKQLDRFLASGLVQPLRALQADLANPDKLARAMRQSENLLPTLRTQAPQLVRRLADCFYWAIVTHGEPNDVPRYERIFGRPAEDPDLHRLQALACERAGDPETAHSFWQRFEQSISKNPAAWPESIAARARALVWWRMGNNAASIPDIDKLPSLPDFLRDHPERPRPLSPGAEECFKRSLALNPDQLEAHEALFHLYRDDGKEGKAVSAAAQLLKHFPDHIQTLEALGQLHRQNGKHAKAVEVFERAAKLNPLDRALRDKLSTARLFLARSFAEEGKYAESRAEYQRALASGGTSDDQVTVCCKWAALEFRAGDTTRAEELLQQARAAGGLPLPIAFSLVIEVIRLKLPRTIKSRFDRDFKLGLEGPADARAAVLLVQIAAAHRNADVSYTGQKTHEKKVLAYLQRVDPASISEAQWKKLCQDLLYLDSVRIQRRFCEEGQRRFPENPWFPFLNAESYFNLGPRSCPRWKMQPLLLRARELATSLPPDPERNTLLEQIAERERLPGMGDLSLPGFMQEFFDSFMDGSFDDDEDFDDYG